VNRVHPHRPPSSRSSAPRPGAQSARADGKRRRRQRITEVSAGLLFRDGKLLITQRRATDHLGGLWEFPGGKRRPGETPAACLKRELREELGIAVTVGKLLKRVTHAYPGRTVRLHFFRCRLEAGQQPRPLACAALRWVGPRDLTDHPFPAADADLLQLLLDRPELWAETA